VTSGPASPGVTSRQAGTVPASANSGWPSSSASCSPLRTVPPAATSSFEMYTGADDPPEEPAAPPSAAEPAADGALGYTSYSVAGCTTPRISTDEVRIWETTAASLV